MANKKIIPIDYTARDFNSIKNQMVEYAKRYYPDTYKDFGVSSFGSMMIDMVSYVGDIMSFYLDYQANESFLISSNERVNIIDHAKSLGYKFHDSVSSNGIAALYISIPGNDVGPYTDYIPTLKKGAILSNDFDVSYILNESVDFSVNPEITIGEVDKDTGSIVRYIFKKYANVISGRLRTETFFVGNFTKFLSLPLAGDNIVEIISVKDSEGNVYYEVDSLAQNIIYSPLKNINSDSSETPYILKPISVPRRYMVDTAGNGRVALLFGYGSEDNLKTSTVVEPARDALDQYGKD